MQAIATAPDPGERRGTALRAIAQAASALIGLAGAAAVLVFGGLLAVFTGCADGSGDVTAFCPEYEDVATTLEVIAVLIGAGASLAGGIATCVTSRARWLLGGLTVGALMFGSILLLVSGQQALIN